MLGLSIVLVLVVGAGFIPLLRLIHEDLRKKSREKARLRIGEVMKMNIPSKEFTNHRAGSRSGHSVTMQSW